MKIIITAILATTLTATVANAAPYVAAGGTAMQGATGTSAAVGWSTSNLNAELGVRGAADPTFSVRGTTLDAYVHGPISNRLGGFFTAGNTWSYSKKFDTLHALTSRNNLLSWRFGAGLTYRILPTVTLRAAARLEDLDHGTIPTYAVDLVFGEW